MVSAIRLVWGSPKARLQKNKGIFAMVRTMSAKLRRSFAQATEIGSTAKNAPATLVAAAILQSILLTGLALTMTLAAPAVDPHALQMFSAFTILTAAFVAYLAVSRITPTQATASSRQMAPVMHATSQNIRFTHHYAQGSSDVEQLARLKARVCHDLRTPLNAVIGFSEMMQHEVLGPVGHERYRDYIAEIRKSAEHFQEATEKTLAVTELLASPRNHQRDAINLGTTVAASLEQFRASAKVERPIWSLDLDSAVVVEGNQTALNDALPYLWDSAVMLADSPAARCSVSCAQAGFGHIDVRFRVDGCDPALVSGDTELSPGTELNLILARLGVEAAGGTISFEVSAPRTWVAILRLPLTTQRELQLH